ncbi:hypothetical protein DSECCO2_625870 [anaerobic digester metagenome]
MCCEVDNVFVGVIQIPGVFCIGSHPFNTIHDKLFQRTDIFVCFSQNPNQERFFVKVFFGSCFPLCCTGNLNIIEFWFNNGADFFLGSQCFIDQRNYGFAIEVGIGDGCENRVQHHAVGFGIQSHSQLVGLVHPPAESLYIIY